MKIRHYNFQALANISEITGNTKFP